MRRERGSVDREKVIKGLECHVHGHPHTRCLKCPYWGTGPHGCSECNMLAADALELLKAQEVATVQPKRIELADETKAWLDKMDAVDALSNIANICIDWDGYRTADGLGGLINEIWAYARYCADRLLKAQEPVEPVMDIDTWKCGNCGHALEHQQLLGDNVLFHEQYNYCPECGKAVKWE